MQAPTTYRIVTTTTTRHSKVTAVPKKLAELVSVSKAIKTVDFNFQFVSFCEYFLTECKVASSCWKPISSRKKGHSVSVTIKNWSNVYKSCPTMISLEKLKIMTPSFLQKLPKNVENLGKLIVAKDFEKLPKVQ